MPFKSFSLVQYHPEDVEDILFYEVEDARHWIQDHFDGKTIQPGVDWGNKDWNAAKCAVSRNVANKDRRAVRQCNFGERHERKADTP